MPKELSVCIQLYLFMKNLFLRSFLENQQQITILEWNTIQAK